MTQDDKKFWRTAAPLAIAAWALGFYLSPASLPFLLRFSIANICTTALCLCGAAWNLIQIGRIKRGR